MKRDIRIASEALFTIVTTCEPRLVPMKPWYETLVRTIDKWAKSEGNQGVARAKKILSQAWLAILGKRTQQLDFVRTVDGVPELAMDLVKRVKSLRRDSRLMSAVLSLVRVTDLWLGEPDKATIDQSLKVIEESRLPVRARSVIKQFGDFLADLMSGAFDHYELVRRLKEPLRLTSEAEFHLHSTKKGPNGALSENAHLDVLTLRRCIVQNGSLGTKPTNLLEEVTLMSSKLAEYIPGWKSSETPLNKFSDEELLKGLPSGRKDAAAVPGKVFLKFEKSGKVRLVAAPDFYTQQACQPLGKWLFNVLDGLPTDCTFDQRSAIPKICRWHDEGRTVYSFDQSSCTDLFPVDMQIELLARRFDRSLAESVKTVLTNREWELTYPKTKVSRKLKWSVGQPMGIYASWPLMAVCHHLLVQFASWRCTSLKQTWKPFEDYAICGDDIVIGSVRVADSYLKLVRDLGMKINMSKSHISGGKTGIEPVSEFAKVTVWKGQPLYELKPNQLRASIRDWRLAIPLLWELHDRSRWGLKLAPLKRIIRSFWPRYTRFLDYLLTAPHELGGCGFRDGIRMWDKFRTTISGGSHIHPLLYFLCERVRSRLLRGIEKAPHGDKAPSWINLDEAAMRQHPDFLRASYQSRLYKPRRSLFRDDRVPPITEIVTNVILNGWSWYGQYLIDESITSEPTAFVGEDRKATVRRLGNLWAKALTEKGHKRLTINEMARVTDYPLFPDIVGSYQSILDELTTRQLDAVTRGVIALRAANGASLL